jgi:hypothetical protein
MYMTRTTRTSLGPSLTRLRKLRNLSREQNADVDEQIEKSLFDFLWMIEI